MHSSGTKLENHLCTVDNHAIIYSMVERNIEKQLRNALGKGRIIVIYGPRRIGKTTLAKKLLAEADEASQLYLNCDELNTQDALRPTSLASLEAAIGNAQRIVIDEAQRVENIGLTLKILIDAHPELDIIATGSSSFDLANKVKEPLTGRSHEFFLGPLSARELQNHHGYSDLQMKPLLDRLMRFGGYPGVIIQDDERAEADLRDIAERYVYKDSLELIELRQRQLLPRLLQALAFQIGQEVSYHEFAVMFGVKLETIERYITILEAAFIVYRLPALRGNARNQLSNRKRKIYFYDLGVRNALINNLNPLSLRDDLGGLWENFCVNERIKWLQANDKHAKHYYWRGIYGEVDLVEQENKSWQAFEFKWSDKKVNVPKTFQETYPDAGLTVIHRDNFLSWLK